MFPDIIDIDKLAFLLGMVPSISAAKRLREQGAMEIGWDNEPAVKVKTRYISGRDFTPTNRPNNPS